MIFLIFHLTRYDTKIISYFFEKICSLVCLYKLSMKLARAISSWYSSCTSDHLIQYHFHHYKNLFLLSKLNINWFLLFFIVSSKLLRLYLITVLATGLPLAKIFIEYARHCVFLVHYYRIIQLWYDLHNLN